MKNVLITMFLSFCTSRTMGNSGNLEKLDNKKLWKYLILKVYMFQGEIYEVYVCMHVYV